MRKFEDRESSGKFGFDGIRCGKRTRGPPKGTPQFAFGGHKGNRQRIFPLRAEATVKLERQAGRLGAQWGTISWPPTLRTASAAIHALGKPVGSLVPRGCRFDVGRGPRQLPFSGDRERHPRVDVAAAPNVSVSAAPNLPLGSSPPETRIAEDSSAGIEGLITTLIVQNFGEVGCTLGTMLDPRHVSVR